MNGINSGFRLDGFPYDAIMAAISAAEVVAADETVDGSATD